MTERKWTLAHPIGAATIAVIEAVNAGVSADNIASAAVIAYLRALQARGPSEAMLGNLGAAPSEWLKGHATVSFERMIEACIETEEKDRDQRNART